MGKIFLVVPDAPIEEVAQLKTSRTLSSRELQCNACSLRQSDTQLGGHWRVAPTWFASGGLAVRTLSFKR